MYSLPLLIQEPSDKTCKHNHAKMSYDAVCTMHRLGHCSFSLCLLNGRGRNSDRGMFPFGNNNSIVDFIAARALDVWTRGIAVFFVSGRAVVLVPLLSFPVDQDTSVSLPPVTRSNNKRRLIRCKLLTRRCRSLRSSRFCGCFRFVLPIKASGSR
jgi:hypothetical protein